MSFRLQEEVLAIREALLKAAAYSVAPYSYDYSRHDIWCYSFIILLSGGGSAQSQHQIDMVIIGGAFGGTFFSLIVVPVAYSYAHKFKQFLKRLRKAPASYRKILKTTFSYYLMS